MSSAIRFAQTGDPSVLHFEDVAVPEPGPGEALVRHEAIGVNFIDVYHRSGLYPVSLPSGLGLEGAGVVEAVGANVHQVKPGERVAYAGGAIGAYAERRVIGADRLVHLPDAISFELAAAAMLKGLTVEYLIQRTYAVKPGQTVLWHAAAGGVGLIACQWLKSLGVRVIGTVGSREKAALAKANGCAETILYREENFVKRVRELTGGEGVPVVYDSVGKDTFMGSLDCLAPRGMLVTYGNASGKPDPLDLTILSNKGSLYVTRPSIAAYTAKREELLASANALFSMMKHGTVKIAITERFPLKDAASAHRLLEARQSTGSMLLMP
ncbi:MAG: quinone oxidoreductase [Polyangiaceae bacterium]